MDENEKQKLQTTSQFNKYHQFLKMTLQFLVSLSLLSLFLLSYSSGFDFQFSTLLFPLFSQTVERKYMFLICNGIVFFLSKNMSFARPPSPTGSDLSNEVAKTNEDFVKRGYKMEASLEIEHKEAAMESTVGPLENVAPIGKQEDEQENNLSTEELNRKVEEFIWKMKKEIRLEAQRQLITV